MHFQTGRFAYTQCYAWHDNDFEGWTEIDFTFSSSFLLPISTNTLLFVFQSLHSLCSYSWNFIQLMMRHLFSIIWNVLSMISDMILEACCNSEKQPGSRGTWVGWVSLESCDKATIGWAHLWNQWGNEPPIVASKIHYWEANQNFPSKRLPTSKSPIPLDPSSLLILCRFVQQASQFKF